METLSSRSYESTSSDESSSDSSDEGSDSSEYHEAREKLPESSVQHQQTADAAPSQPEESNSVPQETQPAAMGPSGSATLPQNPPGTDTVTQKCASQSVAPPPRLTDEQSVTESSEELAATTRSPESQAPAQLRVSRTADVSTQQQPDVPSSQSESAAGQVTSDVR